jgi:hypothetical protein
MSLSGFEKRNSYGLLKREGSNLGAGKLYDFILNKPYRSHDLAYLLSVIKPRI